MYLQHDVLAALLRLEDLERLWLVPGRDDAVAHLDLQELGRREVDDLAHRHEVAEGAERVGLAGAQVGDGGLGEGLAW